MVKYSWGRFPATTYYATWYFVGVKSIRKSTRTSFPAYLPPRRSSVDYTQPGQFCFKEGLPSYSLGDRRFPTDCIVAILHKSRRRCFISMKCSFCPLSKLTLRRFCSIPYVLLDDRGDIRERLLINNGLELQVGNEEDRGYVVTV